MKYTARSRGNRTLSPLRFSAFGSVTTTRPPARAPCEPGECLGDLVVEEVFDDLYEKDNVERRTGSSSGAAAIP